MSARPLKCRFVVESCPSVTPRTLCLLFETTSAVPLDVPQASPSRPASHRLGGDKARRAAGSLFPPWLSLGGVGASFGRRASRRTCSRSRLLRRGRVWSLPTTADPPAGTSFRRASPPPCDRDAADLTRQHEVGIRAVPPVLCARLRLVSGARRSVGRNPGGRGS